MARNWHFWSFGPGLAGSFGALLVGWMVVVARRLYLARHLFTLFDIVTIFRGKNVTKLLELCLFVTPISLLLHLKIVTMAKKLLQP